MGAIAEGFILRAAATADGDDLPAAEVIFIAIFVNDLKIAFYFNRAIAINCNFCGSHVVWVKSANVGKIKDLGYKNRFCAGFSHLLAVGPGFYKRDGNGKMPVIFFNVYSG